jgi:hypothetical protein
MLGTYVVRLGTAHMPGLIPRQEMQGNHEAKETTSSCRRAVRILADVSTFHRPRNIFASYRACLQLLMPSFSSCSTSVHRDAILYETKSHQHTFLSSTVLNGHHADEGRVDKDLASEAHYMAERRAQGKISLLSGDAQSYYRCLVNHIHHTCWQSYLILHC